MAEQSNGGGERTEKPTAKKLADAAKKGDILQSRDLATALVVIAGAGWLAMMGPMLMQAMREMLVGSMMVAAIGHCTYTLVPGAGPYASMSFQRSLDCGGYFWRMALDLVADAGARYDIFPSLHTAMTVFFTLASWRHRKTVPMRYTWPIMVVFSTNIVIATVLLRWHWGIDILAGLLVAGLCLRLAIAISEHEADRAAQGRQPVWEPFFGSSG